MKTVAAFSPFAARRRVAGFTLMEMVMAMTVFGLLVAMVFAMLDGMLQTTAGLQDNQNRSDQVDRLYGFINNRLKNLPADSVLVSYRRGDGDGLVQDGIIFGHGKDLTVLDAKPQSNGYYTIRLATLDPSTLPQNSPALPVQLFQINVINDSGIVWKVLVKDVAHLSWKFLRFNNTTWDDTWADPLSVPTLVEFMVQQAADLKPSTMDFWIPRLVPGTVVMTGVGGPNGGGGGGPGPGPGPAPGPRNNRPPGANPPNAPGLPGFNR